MRKWIIVALVAVVACIVVHIITKDFVMSAIPPGPAPRALKLKPPGTVVINVQPNSDLQGATFVREVTLSPDGEVQYSRIIVSGPTSESRTVTIPIAYELKLTDEDHISKLNEQLKKAEPLEVSLMFDFDGTSKTKLYWMLADARAKDKDVQYSVVLECWYSRNGRYVLSVEDRTLEISDY